MSSLSAIRRPLWSVNSNIVTFPSPLFSFCIISRLRITRKGEHIAWIASQVHFTFKMLYLYISTRGAPYLITICSSNSKLHNIFLKNKRKKMVVGECKEEATFFGKTHCCLGSYWWSINRKKEKKMRHALNQSAYHI